METLRGDRLAIVIHDDGGTRELYHFDRKKSDRAASVLILTDGVSPPFNARYVLILASASPLLAQESGRISDLVTRILPKRKSPDEMEEAEKMAAVVEK